MYLIFEEEKNKYFTMATLYDSLGAFVKTKRELPKGILLPWDSFVQVLHLFHHKDISVDDIKIVGIPVYIKESFKEGK